ncbi:Shwachman-Bodian-diamond syndrome protein [Corynespora cassiicola Philippines]|uniref:Shwachman-Bodian-diamond syndrome protein n=1 Tax=Corynespora cassiicola Philippines TaxID=1448308 RepID=A0A2T2PBC9_CORCC|nr:Shwachman-Bodian-diamond syndrome protein [Corynespora cassiicola Philippines]
MPVNQPMNQIKFTNVAWVRCRKGKKRFEVPCYKNKLSEFKAKVEENIENVVQIQNVFTDSSRGQLASNADLEKAFGVDFKHDKDALNKVILKIINEGSSQTGGLERGAELERTRNEVIDIVTSKVVNPKNKTMYTTTIIAKALSNLSSQASNAQAGKQETPNAENGEEKPKDPSLPTWTGVVPSSVKSAKAQAGIAIKALIAHQPLPIARIQMKLRVTCPTSILKQTVKSAPKSAQSSDGDGENKTAGTVKDVIVSLFASPPDQEVLGSEWEAIGSADPGAFKDLNEFVQQHTKGKGNVEVLGTDANVKD